MILKIFFPYRLFLLFKFSHYSNLSDVLVQIRDLLMLIYSLTCLVPYTLIFPVLCLVYAVYILYCNFFLFRPYKRHHRFTVLNMEFGISLLFSVLDELGYLILGLLTSEVVNKYLTIL